MRISSSSANRQIPFSISAKQSGTKAEVRIIGEIGWQTNSETFRQQVDLLVADGVTDVHLYINSPGGLTTDANEIVNILKRFSGKITGEGGALVASAATYIAMHCGSFEMPENGIFMIHKPHGYAGGTADEIRNYLKLLGDMEQEYFSAYKVKAKDPEDFERKWNAGDNWMTAEEARDAGFITAVTKKIPIDAPSAQMIAACGYPDASAIRIDNQPSHNNQEKMNMEVIALLLGLPKDATEEQIKAAIEALRAKAAASETLEAAMKDMRTSQIKSLVAAGVAARKFTADKSEHYIALGESVGPDMLPKTIDMMPADGKPTDIIAQVSPGAVGKKWEELTAEERTRLRDTDRASYDKMVEAHYKS